jgi:hypothetical protein
MVVESWIMPPSNDGWLLSEFFWIALSVMVMVSLSIIVLGCNQLYCLACLCRVGSRRLLVALVCMYACVIISCKESSVVSRVLSPFKAGFPLL